MDDYKTVYETGKFGLDFHILLTCIVFIVLFAIFIFVVVHNIKFNITVNQETNHKQVVTERVISIICLCVICIVFLITLSNTFLDYSNVKKIYNDGKFTIIEGKVEDFIPMKLDGHSSESFSVNGVKFSYNRSAPTNGYHLTKVDGGYIKENDQEIRIHYVNYNGTNLILKLEIKVDEK